jgi:hypothetical protein
MRLSANERAFLHRAIRREQLLHHDPFQLGGLRVLIGNIPRRVSGLSSLQLRAVAELIRDQADVCDVMADAMYDEV